MARSALTSASLSPVQVGGYVVNFDAGHGRELRYVTVHGAGHMVPQWKPQPALHMFAHFIWGKPL